MKPNFARVTLTRVDWEGQDPKHGDVLETSTGRRYEIVTVKGKRITCRVVPSDAWLIEGATVIQWRWAKRLSKNFVDKSKPPLQTKGRTSLRLLTNSQAICRALSRYRPHAVVQFSAVGVFPSLLCALFPSGELLWLLANSLT